LYTNTGQVDSSSIATAVLGVKVYTHEEHGEPSNGVESLERRDPSEDMLR
jgi:hypothetical protein